MVNEDWNSLGLYWKSQRVDKLAAPTTSPHVPLFPSRISGWGCKIGPVATPLDPTHVDVAV